MIPVLFILPQGLTVTGVNTWAMGAARELSRRGHRVGVVVHGSLAGHAELAHAEAPWLQRVTLDGAEEVVSDGDVGRWADVYGDCARRVAGGESVPVAVIPTRHHACFAGVAELARREPAALRPILWQQVDSRYEDSLIDHYAPCASALVGASDALAASIRERVSDGAVRAIPNAVDPGPDPAALAVHPGKALRLFAACRLDHLQKRVMALVAMSDELTRRGVAHELRIAGDGPARAELENAVATRPSVCVLGPIGSGEIRGELERSHASVLASRAEGLSLAVLESMAAGRPAILTRTRSGAEEAVEHGVSGWIVDAPSQIDAVASVGEALARGVIEASDAGLSMLGRGARARAVGTFSIGAHVDALCQLLGEVAVQPPRGWAEGRPLVLRRERLAPGVVSRAREVLGAHNAVVLHGAGSHTRRLLSSLDGVASRIIAVSDDDSSRWGGTLYELPVVSPAQAASLGADAVLISTDLYENEVWALRERYTHAGMRVHRLYDNADAQ